MCSQGCLRRQVRSLHKLSFLKLCLSVRHIPFMAVSLADSKLVQVCPAHETAMCRFPWLMRTDIPPLLQYPVGDSAFPFVCGLISMFYGLSVRENLRGLCSVIGCFLGGKRVSR